MKTADDAPSQRKARLLAAATVAVSIAIALAIRVVWPWDHVMVSDTVWFRGMDPWYHMRLVDNLIANFPHVTAFDPFTGYPDGIRPPFHPLTDRLIALPALLLGGGAPSAWLIDRVGAFFPVVLGALTVVPVYFVGRALFGRIAGATAAFVLAIIPGEFLSRSLLGFADHHVSEAFFSICTLLFLVLATHRITADDIRLGTIRQGLAPGHRGGLILTALSGISLGLYLLAWRGGVLLLLVVFAYVAVRAIVDYARKSDTDDVIIVCSTAVVIGGAMVLPIVSRTWTPALFIAALLAAALSPVVLRFIARY
ncbi:MAG: STT3 domain-containing protein, partial [Chloroflexota bacterium]